jgi:capsular exopolysaccharide synthesis family protein
MSSKFGKALRRAAHDASQQESAPSESSPSPTPLPARPPLPVSPGTRPPPERSDPAPVALETAPTVDIGDDHFVSLISPAAFEAEQYRALRHVVEQMCKASSINVLAISSPAVGDGKTTTAVNLAGALAQSPDARVVLVDADVRRPAIARVLGPGSTGPGLVDAILDPVYTFDQLVVARPQFNLSFIHAGHTQPRSPYELLKSARLGDLLDEARRRFDYVVVDTPPLASVQDCRLIARWVDGFLVVVAAHRTPRRLVKEALTVVERAKILGLVFNGDDDRAHIGHYGYTGGYFGAAAQTRSRMSTWRVQAPRWATWRRGGALRP